MRMFKTAGVKRFLKDQRGATAIEYTMGVACIAVAITGAIGAIGTTIEKETFARLNTGIITGSIPRQADEPEVEVTGGNSFEDESEPVLRETTYDRAAFEVEEGRMGAVAEWKPLPRTGAPIYTVSVASPSCLGTRPNSGCRPSLSGAVFNGWKGTRED